MSSATTMTRKPRTFGCKDLENIRKSLEGLKKYHIGKVGLISVGTLFALELHLNTERDQLFGEVLATHLPLLETHIVRQVTRKKTKADGGPEVVVKANPAGVAKALGTSRRTYYRWKEDLGAGRPIRDSGPRDFVRKWGRLLNSYKYLPSPKLAHAHMLLTQICPNLLSGSLDPEHIPERGDTRFTKNLVIRYPSKAGADDTHPLQTGRLMLIVRVKEFVEQVEGYIEKVQATAGWPRRRYLVDPVKSVNDLVNQVVQSLATDRVELSHDVNSTGYRLLSL